jgi:hypothetical protein
LGRFATLHTLECRKIDSRKHVLDFCFDLRGFGRQTAGSKLGDNAITDVMEFSQLPSSVHVFQRHSDQLHPVLSLTGLKPGACGLKRQIGGSLNSPVGCFSCQILKYHRRRGEFPASQ